MRIPVAGRRRWDEVRFPRLATATAFITRNRPLLSNGDKPANWIRQRDAVREDPFVRRPRVRSAVITIDYANKQVG